MRLRVGKISPAIISLRELHADIRAESGLPVAIQKTSRRFNHGRSFTGSRIDQPNLQIIRALYSRGRWIVLACQRQIFARTLEIGPGLVKRQLRQRHPCFRDSRALGKIVDEFLERRDRFRFSLCGLEGAFLE